MGEGPNRNVCLGIFCSDWMYVGVVSVMFASLLMD
jgi:hypothetical protein